MPKATVGENPLSFPPPHANGLGSVTVFCGPNGSGKSYLIRALRDLIAGKTLGTHLDGHGWSLETTEGAPLTALRPKHHKAQMTSLGAMSMAVVTKKQQPSDDEVRLKVDVFGQLLRALDPAVTPKQTDFAKMDVDRWRDDIDYRRQLLELFPVDEAQVYFVRGDCAEVLQIFQQEFEARLGFRHAPGRFEAVLAWPFDMTAPYDNWSDGQKSLFTILMSVTSLKPDVYIFDEIENFFHPLLISRALELLKTYVKQIVLTSHHPHLIFGRAVDCVYYVELGELATPLYASKIAKTAMQPAPPRRITRLSSNLEKLANAYRLFDMRDAALLASANYIEDAIDLKLNAGVRHMFECRAVPAKQGAYVDRQTEEIANVIAGFAPSPAVVLDWGAGLARTAAELEKGSGALRAQDLTWLLYEPVPDQCAKLEQAAHLARLNATVLSTRQDLAGRAAGVALLTNVLHALDPRQWAEAIEDCHNAVRGSENGIVVITELYPLLTPERFAAPAPHDLVEDLFSALGFSVHVRLLNIHNASAYCLVASKPPTALPATAELIGLVEDQWRKLQRRLLRAYDGAPRTRSAADRAELLNAAFGVTRIASWFERG